MRCFILPAILLGCLFAVNAQEIESSPTLLMNQYFNSYWSWLTDEQQTTILSMAEDESDINDIQEKILQFYHHSTRPIKTTAKKLLQQQCLDSVSDVVDDEITAELDNFKEPSRNMEVLIDGLTIPLGNNEMICRSILKKAYGHLRASRHHFTCTWTWTPDNGLKYDCNSHV